MKKIILSTIIHVLILVGAYSQEKVIKECANLINNGYYEAALPIANELMSLKNDYLGKIYKAHILYKQRDYEASKELYENIKKSIEKSKRKIDLHANYYLDMLDMFLVEKKYEDAEKILQALEIKLQDMDNARYSRYRKLYFECMECMNEKEKMLEKIAFKKEVFHKLKENNSALNGSDSIEYERFGKKIENADSLGLFVGIGRDENEKYLVSVAKRKTTGDNSEEKTYSKYYKNYGYKYILLAESKEEESKEDNKIVFVSKFYTAGIAYDKEKKEYIYSKQEYDIVGLKKKELKKRGIKDMYNNLVLFRSPSIQEAGEKVALCKDCDGYDFLHPAISENGKFMYVSSNYQNEDIENYDIFYVKKGADGKWDFTTITKLPNKYNTKLKELYPTISGDTLLTISGNGYGIKGGYDIIGIRLVEGEADTNTLITYSYPLNSMQDDYGLRYEKERVVTLVSNRENIKHDQLYEMEYKQPFVKLKVKVVDKYTLKPLNEVDLELSYNEIKNKYVLNEEIEIDSLMSKNKYLLKVSKNKYVIVNNDQEVSYNSNEKEKEVVFMAYKKLEKKEKIELRDILFEYSKADLLSDSYKELDKVLQIIKDNPTAKFELSAHTDSRGKYSYNLKLSQKRAESCVNYLLSKGVSKESLIAKGYGEKQVKNRCKNNVNCTEEEHAVNRRVEIKVLDVK